MLAYHSTMSLSHIVAGLDELLLAAMDYPQRTWRLLSTTHNVEVTYEEEA
jgi:hypothetical protein